MASYTEAISNSMSYLLRIFSGITQQSKTWSSQTLKVLGPLTLDLVSLIFLTGLFITTVCFCSWTLELSDGIASPGRTGFRLTASYGVGAGTSLTILRILQGATSYYAVLVFTRSLEALQWALAGKEAGTRLLTALVLAPSTGPLGLISYIWDRGPHHSENDRGRARRGIDYFMLPWTAWSKTTQPSEKAMAVVRMLLVFIIMPLAGLSLFFNVSIIPVYAARSDFNATAGIGTFNSSLVAPTLAYNGGSLSYGILSQAYGLIDNPQYSVHADPINCTDSDCTLCDSYLFPGGLQTLLPSQTGSDSSPYVIIPNSPAAQLEFQIHPNSTANLTGKDCSVYGNGRSPVGVELCIASDDYDRGILHVDLYVCSDGVSNGTCLQDGPRLNMSMATSAYQRRATTVSALSNNSIMTVSQLTTPQRVLFSEADISGLRNALGWLLNYTAADIPPVSSLAYQLWNHEPGPSEHDWAIGVIQTLESTLAFALWFFTENNYGNPDFKNATTAQDPSTILSGEYHTTASFANSYIGFVIDENWFIVYVVLQSLPILASWAVVIWFMWMRVAREKVSSFPLVDFRYKMELRNGINIASKDLEGDRAVIRAIGGSITSSIRAYSGV